MENSKIKFKYNNKIYQTSNLTNQLQRLGITENDIEIIKEAPKKMNDIKVYHFQNTVTGYTITSIYEDLSHLNYIKHLEQWIKLD